MTLCLPFLMFQGRAQEAIDHYLQTFPDAELLEIQHHLEGTEIFDPAAEHAAETEETEDSDGEDAEEAEDSGDAEDTEDPDPAEDADEETEDSEQSDEAEGSEQTAEPEEAAGPEDAEAPAEKEEADAAEAAEDSVPEELPILVATAQLRIGGQVLMLQDSLVKHQFSFTPSTSVAVVVDSGAEFDQIVGKLAEGGHYLMEPGDYEFAKNFAWVTDRFGVSWQVNHPLGAPDENIAPAKAPEWG